MARPLKTGGIEYFPLDSDWDRKVRLFKARFKLEGIGFLVTLFQEIYRDGYFISWDEETQILFSDEHSIDRERMQEMVEFALDKEIFNHDIYDRKTILTSRGIQKRFLRGCCKRQRVGIEHDLILLDETEIKDNINPDKVVINGVKDDYGYTNRKGKGKGKGNKKEIEK